MKEIIIIVLVIIIVVTVGNITQNYLEKTSNEILEKLETLKLEIKNTSKNNNIDIINDYVEQIISNWKEINKNWSMLVIHEELDNIEISLLELKASIENQNIEDSLKKIEKSMFLIEHIKEKENLQIKNIF